MSTTSAILLALLVVAVAILAITLARLRRPVAETGQGPGARAAIMDPGAVAENEPEADPVGVIAVTTARPNEVYLFGPAAEVEEFGRSLAAAPRQLGRYATGLRAGTDAARSFAELSGRLVLVDDKTAAALRSGRMMKDKAGEILGHVLREDGKVSSITRLKDIGSLAATATSLTNALSAMAMQAQLDRIERQLSTLRRDR